MAIAAANPERERRSVAWGHHGAVVLGGVVPGVAVAGPWAPATAVIGPSAGSAAVIGPAAGSAAVVGPAAGSAAVVGPAAGKCPYSISLETIVLLRICVGSAVIAIGLIIEI